MFGGSVGGLPSVDLGGGRILTLNHAEAIKELSGFRELIRSSMDKETDQKIVGSLLRLETEPTAEALLGAWALMNNILLDQNSTLNPEAKEKFRRLTLEAVKSKSLDGMEWVQSQQAAAIHDIQRQRVTQEVPKIFAAYVELREEMSPELQKDVIGHLSRLREELTAASLIEAWALINSFWLEKKAPFLSHDFKHMFEDMTEHVLKTKKLDEYFYVVSQEFEMHQKEMKELSGLESKFDTLGPEDMERLKLRFGPDWSPEPYKKAVAALKNAPRAMEFKESRTMEFKELRRDQSGKSKFSDSSRPKTWVELRSEYNGPNMQVAQAFDATREFYAQQSFQQAREWSSGAFNS